MAHLKFSTDTEQHAADLAAHLRTKTKHSKLHITSSITQSGTTVEFDVSDPNATLSDRMDPIDNNLAEKAKLFAQMHSEFGTMFVSAS